MPNKPLIELEHLDWVVDATRYLCLLVPALMLVVFLWRVRAKPRLQLGGMIFTALSFGFCLLFYEGSMRWSGLKSLDVWVATCGLLTLALAPLVLGAYYVSRSRQPVLAVVVCIPVLAAHIFQLFTLLTNGGGYGSAAQLVLPLDEVGIFVISYFSVFSVAAVHRAMTKQGPVGTMAVWGGTFWLIFVGASLAVLTDFAWELHAASTASADELRVLWEHGHFRKNEEMLLALAANPKAPEEILRPLSTRRETRVRALVASNPNASPAVLATLSTNVGGSEFSVLRNLIQNKHTPCPQLAQLVGRSGATMALLAQAQLAKRCPDGSSRSAQATVFPLSH